MKTYQPDGDTLRRFLASPARVKVIQGPIGSGKSLACAMHVWLTALEQKPQSDGRRRCRAHVFRNSYPKLEETTVKTWLDWFPEREFGRFYWTKPFLHEIRVGDVELDVHFVALEDERAIDFFKSLETTITWYNELQYIDRALFDEGTSRIGRYPALKDGGAVSPRAIADTNAPPSDNWIPIMRGDVPAPDWMTEDQRRTLVRPAEWEFFMQPAGLTEVRQDGEIAGYRPNPEAENTRHLEAGYYVKAIEGKGRGWINQNVMNKSDVVTGGKPVFRDFRAEIHVAKEAIVPVPGVPVVIGVDFGRQPAAVFCQQLRGRWYVVHELIGRDIGAAAFAPMLKMEMAQRFAGFRFALWGDPSGDYRGQADDRTPFQIFRGHGLPIQPAPTNLLTIRLQAVEAALTRMSEGRPSFMVSPRCTTVVAGMAGGYHYRRIAVGGERYSDEPEKNQYSHPADALQYALVGGGEGRALLTGGKAAAKPVQTKKTWSVMRR